MMYARISSLSSTIKSIGRSLSSGTSVSISGRFAAVGSPDYSSASVGGGVCVPVQFIPSIE